MLLRCRIQIYKSIRSSKLVKITSEYSLTLIDTQVRLIKACKKESDRFVCLVIKALLFIGTCYEKNHQINTKKGMTSTPKCTYYQRPGIGISLLLVCYIVPYPRYYLYMVIQDFDIVRPVFCCYYTLTLKYNIFNNDFS